MAKQGRPKKPGATVWKKVLLSLPAELVGEIDARADLLEKRLPMLDANRAMLIRLGMSWVVNATDEELLKGMTGKRP